MDPSNPRFPGKARSLLLRARKDQQKGDLISAVRKAKFATILDPGDDEAAALALELTTLYCTGFPKNLTCSAPITQEEVLQALGHTAHSEHDADKTIWLYWDQGILNAPEIVKACLRSWRDKNPGYRIIVLDRSNLGQYLGFDLDALLTRTSLALRMPGQTDLIRLILLARHGGLWVDATTLCLQPLESWLPKASARHGFFCFRQVETDDIYDRRLVSWFLYATPRHPLIVRLLELALDYLFCPRNPLLIEIHHKQLRHVLAGFDLPPKSMDETGHNLISFCEAFGFYPYFWIFYLFSEAVREAPFQQLWTDLQTCENGFCQPLAPFEVFRAVKVAKMTHKNGYPETEIARTRLAHVLGAA